MENAKNRKIIGILLFSAACLVAFFITGRALYYAPGSDPVGLSATSTGMVLAKTISGTAEESNEPLPSRLVIPKLGIDADVQHLGVTPHGLMAAPKNFTDVSWYKLGTVPGARGSAVMAGHEDNAISLDGVFKHLDELEVGDEVRVVRQDGSALRFRVIKKEIQPYNLTGPTLREIFTRSDGRYLNLITCAGEWLPEAHTNDRRLIVYTELIS